MRYDWSEQCIVDLEISLIVGDKEKYLHVYVIIPLFIHSSSVSALG